MTARQPSPSRPVSVLFVCLGNICRSPLAEGVFRALVTEAGLSTRFRVDSAGTGSWHVGDPPDRRSIAVAQEHGIELAGTARQALARDLREFDWVIAMDADNLRTLERLGGRGTTARLHLLREFDPDGRDPADGTDVPDPYYGGPDGFNLVYGIVERSCRELLEHILRTTDRET